MKSFANILKERFGAGQPTLTENVLAAFSDEPRSTVFYRLTVETESGRLAKFDRGVYYVPERVELFGRTVDVPLDPERVIARKYLEQDGEVIGFVSGLALENRSRVSNQVPAVLEITTNAETNRRRRIRPFGGYREVVLKKPRVPVTTDNVDVLEAIDLVENVDVASLDESELEAFRRKVAKADWSKAVECLSAYPKKTVMKYLKKAGPAYVLA